MSVTQGWPKISWLLWCHAPLSDDVPSYLSFLPHFLFLFVLLFFNPAVRRRRKDSGGKQVDRDYGPHQPTAWDDQLASWMLCSDITVHRESQVNSYLSITQQSKWTFFLLNYLKNNPNKKVCTPRYITCSRMLRRRPHRRPLKRKGSAGMKSSREEG